MQEDEDQVSDTEQALADLISRVENIKRELSNPDLNDVERKRLEDELEKKKDVIDSFAG